METFQHCRDKCLHSVVSDTTILGVYPTHMTISVFPPIDAHFFFPGTADGFNQQTDCVSVEQAPLIVAQSIDSHTVGIISPMMYSIINTLIRHTIDRSLNASL